jgi:hypothetical protein
MERMVKATIALIRSVSMAVTDWLPGLARFPAARAGALEMTPILEISMLHHGSASENLPADDRGSSACNLSHTISLWLI